MPPKTAAADISNMLFKDPFAGNHPKIILKVKDKKIKFMAAPASMPKERARTLISSTSANLNRLPEKACKKPPCARAPTNQNADPKERSADIRLIIRGLQDSPSA